MPAPGRISDVQGEKKGVMNMLEKNDIKKYVGSISDNCPMCQSMVYLNLTRAQKEEYVAYLEKRCYQRVPVQDALLSFDRFEREFVITSYCPECQKKIFRVKNYQSDAYKWIVIPTDKQEAIFGERGSYAEFVKAVRSSTINGWSPKLAVDIINSDPWVSLPAEIRTAFMYELDVEDVVVLSDGEICYESAE